MSKRGKLVKLVWGNKSRFKYVVFLVSHCYLLKSVEVNLNGLSFEAQLLLDGHPQKQLPNSSFLSNTLVLVDWMRLISLAFLTSA